MAASSLTTQTTHDDPQTTVLQTTELLELILLNLSWQELLLKAQSVSRYWKDVFEGSVQLQRRIPFMAPAESSEICLVSHEADSLCDGLELTEAELGIWHSKYDRAAVFPVLARFHPLLEANTNCLVDWHSIIMHDIAPCKRPVFGAANKNESWRSMLISQPLPENAHVMVEFEACKKEGCPHKIRDLWVDIGDGKLGPFVDFLLGIENGKACNQIKSIVVNFEGITVLSPVEVQDMGTATKAFKTASQKELNERKGKPDAKGESQEAGAGEGEGERNANPGNAASPNDEQADDNTDGDNAASSNDDQADDNTAGNNAASSNEE